MIIYHNCCIKLVPLVNWYCDIVFFSRVFLFPLSLFHNFAVVTYINLNGRYKFLPIDSVVKQNRQYIPTNIISYGQPLHGQVPDKKSCSKSHITSRLLLKWLNCRCCYETLPLQILIHIFFYHGATEFMIIYTW